MRIYRGMEALHDIMVKKAKPDEQSKRRRRSFHCIALLYSMILILNLNQVDSIQFQSASVLMIAFVFSPFPAFQHVIWKCSYVKEFLPGSFWEPFSLLRKKTLLLAGGEISTCRTFFKKYSYVHTRQGSSFMRCVFPLLQLRSSKKSPPVSHSTCSWSISRPSLSFSYIALHCVAVTFSSPSSISNQESRNQSKDCRHVGILQCNLTVHQSFAWIFIWSSNRNEFKCK